MMRPDWNKITEEAFSSEEEHIFSESYCRRRAELQGGTDMEKRRRIQKTHRFNAGMAATAAALIMIPAATIGVLHFTGGSSSDNGSKLGASVTDTTDTTAYTKPAETATTALTTAVTEVSQPVVSEDPSYLRGNYQMVFAQTPEGFAGVDAGQFFDEYTDYCITPGWFYNVEGSYKRIFAECEKEMEFTGTVTYISENGTRECDVFLEKNTGNTKYLIKFENTNFVGVLDVESGIEEKRIGDFINAIQLMSKAELEKSPDDSILISVGGKSVSELNDPEAAMLKSDVFRFSAKVEMAYDLNVKYAPAGYNLDRKEAGNWTYSNPSDSHSICFSLYNYGGEAYKDRLISYLTSNSVNNFLDHSDVYDAGSGKQAYICCRKEGPYNGETQAEWNDRKAKGWDNRDVIIFNGQTGYAVNFTVNDHMSDEELKKVIDGIEFVKLDTPETATSYLPWLIGSEEN